MVFITADGIRFSTQADVRSRGAWYASKAKAALKDNLEHICVENIQACVLVGNTFFGDCDADAESLYFGKSPSDVVLVRSTNRLV
jgi:hypothetical protein